MNKNFMALAVAGALAAPGLALAQATTSGTNVQIYGLFDVRFDHMKLTSSTANTAGVSNISGVTKQHLSGGAPNRIGFRGTEALGGGMEAFFQVETQVFTDARGDTGAQQTTNATLGGRPTFLGLRGNWGAVSAGYQESVYKDVYLTTWSVNPSNAMFGAIMGNGNTSGSMPTPSCVGAFASGTNNFQGVASTTGSATVAAPQGGLSSTTPATVRDSTICSEATSSTTAFNRTMSDSIAYRTPVFAGFRFSTMLVARENKEPSSATPAGTGQMNQSFGAYSLTWSGGPFSVAGAYEVHNGFRAANPVVGTAAAAVTLPNRSAKDTGLTLGARFNYGAGLIGAGWERLRYGNTAVAGAENNFDLKNWIFQGTFNLTASDVLWAGYSKTNGRTNCGASLISATAAAAAAATAAGTTACGKETGAKFLTFGVDHAFSKRTGVYAYWSKIDNNNSATYNYLSDSRNTGNGAGASGGLAAGIDSTSYNVGVKHSF